MACGNVQVAGQLLERAMKCVPSKAKSQVVLDCSRVKEFTGDVAASRSILKKYRAEIYTNSKGKKNAPWKIYLEALLVEKRDGQIKQAIVQAKRALKIHSGTGRLWAMLIQLEHQNGPSA